MSKPVTVAILYGFTEGTWHGKKLRRLLREAGYSISKDVAKADIVIAHSAGAFYVPHKLKAGQVLMLINPPYWPERALSTRARNMTLQIIRSVKPGNQPFYHLHKTSRNVGYLVRHARTNQAMMHRADTFNLEREIRHQRTILVRNSNDPWLTPHLDTLQKLNPSLKIHRLSGDHDDCWLYPERYINLLQSDI